MQVFDSYPSLGGALFRGNDLGGASGAFTRVTFGAPVALINGLLPGALADTDLAGSGSSFATYDSSTDDAGQIGVRALRAEEYASGPTIQNPANGGVIASTANFSATGEVRAAGASNTLNTLTLEPGSNVGLEGQTLSLLTDMLLVRDGAAGSAISSGRINTGLTGLRIHGDGVLTLGAGLSHGLTKYGRGTLTVTTPAGLNQTFTVVQGSLHAAAGDPLRRANVNLQRDGLLDLQTQSTRLGTLIGDGTVALGTATLAVGEASFGLSRSSFDGTITGAGDLAITGSSQLTLTSENTYSGRTLVTFDRATYQGGSTLVLEDEGTALASSEFVVEGGSRLRLANTVHSLRSRLGRAPITLDGSALELENSSLSSFTQNAGELRIGGATRVNFIGDSVTSAFAFTSLDRRDRGTLQMAVPSAGAQSAVHFPAALAALLVGDGATPTRRGVLPFATVTVGEFGNPQLATFDPQFGIRALMAAEQSSTLSAGENVQLTSDTTLNTSITVNALNLGTRSLFGNGTLGLASGVLALGGVSSIQPAIELGASEGVFFASGAHTLLGQIAGSNGLTLTRQLFRTFGSVTLAADNTFTGPLTLNGVVVNFSTLSNLGAGSSPITLHDSTLSRTQSGPLEITRDLRLTGREAHLGGTLTLAGTISGPSALSLSGDITLTGANSYEGVTTSIGTLTFSSDAVFGASPRLVFGSFSFAPRLVLTGDWTTARALHLRGSGGTATLDTGRFNATIGGVLTADASDGPTLSKIGAGTLTLAALVDYPRLIEVNGGALQLDGTLVPGGNLNVSAQAMLRGNGTAQRPVTIAGTLAPGSGVGTIRTQNLTLQGGATLAFELASALVYDRAEVTGSVTLNGSVNLELALLAGFDPADGTNLFTVLLNDGIDPILSTAPARFSHGGNVLDEQARFVAGGQEFEISYRGGDGNDVTLRAVPEPSAAALALSGLALLASRRRRRL